MEIKLHNTLTRKKEKFKPLKKGKVSFYSCGPTVYSYQHIGNLRSYIFADLLKRTLQFNDYKVDHIINVTDVGHLTNDSDSGDDKMELAAKKENRSAEEIAKFYFNAFHEDLKKLNFIEPKKWTWATKYIKEQIKLVKKLEEKGYTYETSDGIYFDTSKLKDYGKLANLQPDNLKEGKRIAMGEKKNKTDFALWKFPDSKEQRHQEWPSPWGIGFPGWHIECSAMSMTELGETIDIHTGGEDHIHVHHPNEIAQSESTTGKTFVNYWVHHAFVTNSEGQKISKSKGGLYTLSELEDLGYLADEFKFYVLSTHYKKPLQFSFENLDSAKKSLSKLKNKYLHLKEEDFPGESDIKKYETKFHKAINDNLNTPLAITIIREALEDQKYSAKARVKFLENSDKILGLDIKSWRSSEVTKKETPKEIQDLLDQRQLAREAKDFAQSDILRNIIKEKGYEIHDSTEGQTLKSI
jgi:cysteinyl-tRNA synthetase